MPLLKLIAVLFIRSLSAKKLNSHVQTHRIRTVAYSFDTNVADYFYISFNTFLSFIESIGQLIQCILPISMCSIEIGTNDLAGFYSRINFLISRDSSC